MFKSSLLFTSALALSLFLNTDALAQTKIWGVGSSVGVAEAEFQNSFIQDTIGPYDPNAWTALTVYENWGNTTGGASHAFWTRSTLGHSQGLYSSPPYYNPTPLPSPSLSNGIAIFDSDFLDNDSISVGAGSSPAKHRGELISPRIDLTGYTDSALVVKFFSQYVANGVNTDELSVSMSTDDGTTWSTPFDYRILQEEDVAGFVSVPMPTVTAGVTNLTECRIRFVFDTYYFFASIDDISIEIAPDYDIAIGKSSHVNNVLGKGDIVRISGNQYFPLSNIDPTDLKEWFWGAKLINFGGKTLYPQDNAQMRVSIDFYESNTGNLVSNVYSDTLNVDTLEAGQYNGKVFIAYLKNLDFIINNGAGEYRVKYWVTHDHSDATTDNDTAYHSFNITSKTSSYLSKAGLSTSDNRVAYSRRYFPGNGNYTHFEWGSAYHFPKGQTNNIRIDSIDFRYFIPTYSGPDSQTLVVNIYTIDDGSGATPANGYIGSDELTLVAEGYVLLTNLTSMAPKSYGIATATNFVDALGNPMGALEDDQMYFISIVQTAASGGGASFNYSNGISIAGEYQNYALNRLMSIPDTLLINTSRVTQTAVGQTPNSYGLGYGLDNVPSIGIHFAPDSTTTSIAQVEANNSPLMVTPNPATKNIQIEMNLTTATDVQYTLTDAMGRVLKTVNSKQVTSEIQTINIESLPTGVYFLTAKTDQEKWTQRIIKQ
ncbi:MULTISPECIES: T9SS type A sorting domain-containing protein [unclassified Aureispira]|uniref:T9SS type A sorting domain-containing protein n=1 Tax=unclassified Aureispira TaxID=2649989 RepID=UPI0006965AE1|nr:MULTISPECIES: T9SS type A sorting domain-containing protein [unclassified Aureispira]WMX16118.1 T9SS type A sorting domain-containing protein [Aureispira sp. CCB-E]